MDFELTPDQIAIRDTVRKFAANEIAPNVAEWDRTESFPREMHRKMAALGLLGGTLPARYGGSEMDYVTLALVVEELSYYSPMAGVVSGHPSCSLGTGLLLYGTEEQKSRYLTPTLSGDLAGAAAVTEAHSGTDIVRHMETTARPVAGGYRVNGSKVWVSNILNSDWFITFATLDKGLGHQGICACVIESKWDGVRVNPFHNKVGARTFVSGEVQYDDVFVPMENLVGEEGQGYKVLMAGTEIGRLACAARAVGQIRACLDLSVKYALSREVFSKPISQYQLIQEKITRMRIGLDAAALLTHRLAALKDQGIERVQKEASIAKLYATDTLMQAATDAMQIHGAYSCSEDYEVGRIWRDAKFMQIYDGTNEIHTTIIAEHELGYRNAREARS